MAVGAYRILAAASLGPSFMLVLESAARAAGVPMTGAAIRNHVALVV